VLDWLSVTLLGTLVVAAVFGGMVFFAAVFTPLVFTRLPAEIAGAFIRQVFPVYYLAMTVGCVGAAMLLAFPLVQPVEVAILAAVAIGFMAARRLLLPRIDALRDRTRNGDAAAERRFNLMHRASVVLNTVQLLAVATVLVRLIA